MIFLLVFIVPSLSNIFPFFYRLIFVRRNLSAQRNSLVDLEARKQGQFHYLLKSKTKNKCKEDHRRKRHTLFIYLTLVRSHLGCATHVCNVLSCIDLFVCTTYFFQMD